MLREIDAGGVAVRTGVMETGHPELGRDIVAALGDIGDQFDELRFLVQAVAKTGLSIRDALDEQGADVRTVSTELPAGDQHSTSSWIRSGRSRRGPVPG